MDALKELFGREKPLIGMCHVRALPGRPQHDAAGGIDAVVEAILPDLAALQGGGVDGVLFCNEFDIPYQLRADDAVVAGMAAAIGRVRVEVRVPFGVNLLWDPRATIAVARATGASFVREVFTGVFDSDQGIIEPRIGDLMAFRHAIGADDVAVFTNITPEFSRSLSGRSVAERARGAAFMGVDAILISGFAAGASAEMSDLTEAKGAVDDVPVIANTGVTHENVLQVLEVADGAIVGTSLKEGGITWNPVDQARVERMVELAERSRG